MPPDECTACCLVLAGVTGDSARLEQHGRRLLHAHGRPAALEAAAGVVHEARLAAVRQVAQRAAGHPAQQRHELRAVADAERERVGPRAERGKLRPQAPVAPHGARPALGAVQHVRVAEPADSDQAGKNVQGDGPAQQDRLVAADLCKCAAMRVSSQTSLNCHQWHVHAATLTMHVCTIRTATASPPSLPCSGHVQADVLRACGISQLLDAALSGYNVCIFAYGQTVSRRPMSDHVKRVKRDRPVLSRYEWVWTAWSICCA